MSKEHLLSDSKNSSSMLEIRMCPYMLQTSYKIEATWVMRKQYLLCAWSGLLFSPLSVATHLLALTTTYGVSCWVLRPLFPWSFCALIGGLPILPVAFRPWPLISISAYCMSSALSLGSSLICTTAHHLWWKHIRRSALKWVSSKWQLGVCFRCWKFAPLSTERKARRGGGTELALLMRGP